MPRPRAVERKVQFSVYLTPENAARVRLATFTPSRVNAAYGQVSALINEALDAYFKENPECMTQPQQPA